MKIMEFSSTTWKTRDRITNKEDLWHRENRGWMCWNCV